MSGYDYAADILKSPAEAPPAAAQQTDYASELLSPKQDRFATNVQQRINEERDGGIASFGGMVKAGMVDDQQTKIRILAKDLFPDEPDAVKRFGVKNGEIVYQGDDGKLYKAESGGFTGGLKSFAANMLGNAPTIAGGVAGAVAGAGLGPASAVALGALGAAGGKGLQQTFANLAFDEPQSVAGNLLGMGKEAAFGGAGALAGKAIQGFSDRNVARDVSRFDPAAVAELDRKAAAQQVTLNAAQRTNVPSIKGRAEALARLPQTADEMNASLEATRQQANQAADRFVASISPVDNIDEAGSLARNATKDVLAKLTAERSAQARPLYKQAFEEFQEFPEPLLDRLTRLRQSPSFKDAERVAGRLYQDDLAAMGSQELPQASALRDLHYTKLALDKLIGDEAKGGYNRTSRNALIGLKNELLDIMDTSAPTYKQARQTFAHMTPNIESVKDGVISRITDLTDEQAMQASRLMFSPQMSPTAIGRARVLFLRSGKETEWNAMLRGYLQDTLEQAGREFKSGATDRAVTWRYAMLGNKKQANNLQAAMSNQQWDGFREMMDVFEAVGRVKGAGNSITMPMQEAASELRKEAGSGLVKKALAPRQTLIDWVEEARLGKHAARQVEILNDPQALKKLKALRQLSPNDKKFIQGFSSLFGLSSSPE